MNPVITKMEHFVVIVNSFQPFAIVAKSSILNIVGFLTKAVGWFYAYLTGKYLNKLEKHILDSLILLNLQHLQPQLTQLQSQPS